MLWSFPSFAAALGLYQSGDRIEGGSGALHRTRLDGKPGRMRTPWVRIVHSGDALKRKLKFSGRFALTSIAAAMLALASPLGLGPRPRPPQRAVLARRGDAGRDRSHQHDGRGAGQPAHPRRAARGLSRRQRRLQPGSARPPGRRCEKRADGRLFVRLVSDRGVQEPFVDVILEISWATGRLVREYTLLFDPPATQRAPAHPGRARHHDRAGHLGRAARGDAAAAGDLARRRRRASSAKPPRASSARRATRSAKPSARPPKRARRPRTGIARRPTSRPERARRRLPASTSTGSSPATRCRRSPAARSARASRSTRCWWRCSAPTRAPSPASNMNRLKAGVVLSVPSAEAAQGVTPARGAPDDHRPERRLRRLPADARRHRRMRAAGRAEHAPGARARSRPRSTTRRQSASADARQAHAQQGQRAPPRRRAAPKTRWPSEQAAAGRRSARRRAEQEPRRPEAHPGHRDAAGAATPRPPRRRRAAPAAAARPASTAAPRRPRSRRPRPPRRRRRRPRRRPSSSPPRRRRRRRRSPFRLRRPPGRTGVGLGRDRHDAAGAAPSAVAAAPHPAPAGRQRRQRRIASGGPPAGQQPVAEPSFIDYAASGNPLYLGRRRCSALLLARLRRLPLHPALEEGQRRDLVPREPPAARLVLRRQRRPAHRHPRCRRQLVVDDLLAVAARRDRRRRPGRRGRRLPRLRPRPAGRGNPQGGDAQQPRAPRDPHQAARGLRQAARHQGLRAARDAAVRADARRGRGLGQGAGARLADRSREPAVPRRRRAGASDRGRRGRRAARREHAAAVDHPGAVAVRHLVGRRFGASATAPSTASTSTSTTRTSASPSRPAALDATESIPPRPAAEPASFSSDDAEDAARRRTRRARAGPDTRDEPLAFDLSGISLDLDQPVDGGRRSEHDAPFGSRTTAAIRSRASSSWPRSSSASATRTAPATCCARCWPPRAARRRPRRRGCSTGS